MRQTRGVATIEEKIDRRDAVTVGSYTNATSDAVATAVVELTALLAQNKTVALSCDATLEGILGAVGISYCAHAQPERVRLVAREACQQQLGETIVDCPSDTCQEMVALGKRVYRGFVRHIAQGCTLTRAGTCPTNCRGDCIRRLIYAAASCEPYAPEAVHRYLRLVFSQGGRVRALVSDQSVINIDSLARLTSNECEHTRQFVRFSQYGQKTLTAVFRPRADTIPLTATHFARRMGTERFCIIDPIHLVGAFHEPQQGIRGCSIVRLDRSTADELIEGLAVTENERYIQALWKRFYDGLALPGRDRSQRGYDLRAQWIPRRFWQDLTELEPTAVALR